MISVLDSVDIYSPEFRLDPYPIYRALRENAPVFKEPVTGHYLVTRYEDVLRIFNDPTTFSSIDHTWRPVARGEVDQEGRGGGMAIIQDDDPYHALGRGLFSPRVQPSHPAGVSAIHYQRRNRPARRACRCRQ